MLFRSFTNDDKLFIKTKITFFANVAIGFTFIYIGTGSDRLYEHLRAKEGGKEKTGFSSSHGPLCFITSHSCVNRVFACFCAENEAPA